MRFGGVGLGSNHHSRGPEGFVPGRGNPHQALRLVCKQQQYEIAMRAVYFALVIF